MGARLCRGRDDDGFDRFVIEDVLKIRGRGRNRIALADPFQSRAVEVASDHRFRATTLDQVPDQVRTPVTTTDHANLCHGGFLPVLRTVQ